MAGFHTKNDFFIFTPFLSLKLFYSFGGSRKIILTIKVSRFFSGFRGSGESL